MPDELVVDTNVLSFVLKRSRDAARYLPHLEATTIHVSFMTLAELDRWILRSNWGTDRQMTYERIVSGLVVFPSSRDLGRTWASVMVTTARLGRPTGTADAWIAATALLLDLPLVTDNRRDFEAVPGLRIIHEPRPA